ncbi:MAG: potassium channel protein [Ignavibacteriales bacterium]|nr:potassium channel protein [Ignavibacteriales bacterium]
METNETKWLVTEFEPVKRAMQLVGLLVLILVMGVLGYHFIEGWSFFDSLYMTVITLATVGYGETHPLSLPGRVFTITLIMGGMGIILTALTEITVFVVEGEMTGFIRRRRMNQLIGKLSGHHILCGSGKTGQHVLEELLRTKRKCVVIESDPEKAKKLSDAKILVIEGDATEDDILTAAGIERAAGIVTTLPTDRDNLFVVITARGMNPGLRIISKIEDISARDKFLRSGANAAISSNYIGGLRMASELIRPQTTNFLDTMLRDNSALRVDEVVVGQSSKHAGKSLEAFDELHSSGVVLLSLIRSGAYQFNPRPDTKLQSGDTLIMIGNPEQISVVRSEVL